MKKSLILMVVLAMVMSMFVIACGDDETDVNNPMDGDVDGDEDPMTYTCEQYLTQWAACNPEDVPEGFEGLTGEALAAALTAYCEGADAPSDTVLCCAQFTDCDEFAYCNENVTVCEDPSTMPEKCVEDDCMGATMCSEEDVFSECEVFCAAPVDTNEFNEDCSSSYGFMTEKFGACQPAPCSSDADCEGLGACDDPSKTSTKEFVCNMDAGEANCGTGVAACCKRSTTAGK